MAKINSIEALRDHALEALEQLASGQIDTTQAGVTGKLCESVISTVKAQLEYCRMIDEEPQIPFMSNSQASGARLLQGSAQSKGLPAPKK